MSPTSPYAGKRVLVTGGLGFIGSNLAIALVERGAEVTVLDSMLPQYGARLSNIDPVRDRVRVNLSDLRDSIGLRYLVADQDLIFNLAGQVSHLHSMQDPITDLQINCQSQLSLLECCRAINPKVRLVLASTRQVYGRPVHVPVDETHPTVPVDINGVHKLAAETYYQIYHRVHGLPANILRLTNTFGPRMDLTSRDKGVVGVFVRQALCGESLQLFGDGKQLRDFNYVDDVVEALLLAGLCDVVGGIFNLGHPQPLSLFEFVTILQRITGCRFEHVAFPEDQRAIEIGDYWGDFSKFRELTGWQPMIDVERGIHQTVAYFRDRPQEYAASD